MGHQATPDGSLVLPSGLYQFMSNTEGTALLFELMVALPRLRLPTRPNCPPHPSPTPYRLNS